MIKKLLVLTTQIVIWAAFSMGLALPAYAQDNSQIVNGLCQGADLKITTSPGAGCSSNGESVTEKFNNLLRHLVNWISAIIGVVAVVMIIFGGFRYITSGGSDTSITSAKNTILYAVIGLIIVALSQLLVRFVIRLTAG